MLANESRDAKTPDLIAQVGANRVALPLRDVLEVMRPLPVSALAGAPPSVLGAAVVRGAAVPVVDARALLGESSARACTRFVSLRVGARSAALAVDAVLEVRAVEDSELASMPPLLRDAASGAAGAVGVLDERLLLVLRAARIVPEEAWRALAAKERA